jgi:hypothetical protein
MLPRFVTTFGQSQQRRTLVQHVAATGTAPLV